MSRYNTDKIIRVDLMTKKADSDFKYFPEKKILGLFKQEEFIKGCFGTTYSLDSFKDIFPGYFIEEGIVYSRPSVRIKYQGDITMRRYFTSDGLAERYRDEITDKFLWIED